MDERRAEPRIKESAQSLQQDHGYHSGSSNHPVMPQMSPSPQQPAQPQKEMQEEG